MSLLLSLDHVHEDRILENLKYFKNTAAAQVIENHLLPSEAQRNGAYSALSAKREALRQKANELRDAWKREERKQRERGGTITPEELAQHARLEKKVDRADAAYRSAWQEQLPAAMPIDAVLDFVSEANKPYVDARVNFKLPKGQTLGEALDAVRAKKTLCLSRESDTHRALVSFEDAVARLTADVDQLAEKGRPDFQRTTRLIVDRLGAPPQQGHTVWPRSLVETGAQLVEHFDAMQFIAWLNRDSIIARGRAELESLYAGKETLSTVERTKTLAALDAEHLRLERIEESIIEQCERAGVQALRLPGMRPEAVLGVQLA